MLRVDIAAASPRVRADEVARGHRAAAREVLVRLKPAQASISSLKSDPLGDVDMDEGIGRGGWRLVRSRSRSADLLAQILRARSDIEFAEPNFAVTATGLPDDFASPLWALQNTGQRLENGDTGTPGVDLDATHAWDITQGTRSVVVATVDTGVMQTHRDLAANLWSAPRPFTVTIGGQSITCPAGSHGFNAVDHTCDPADDNGHGTHVAGSIGAVGNNMGGVVGINWTTSIMALKFMDADGNGYVSDAINAIEFALQVKQTFAATGEANIRILNNSWTGGGFSQALKDEITRAAAADMLFVASAGNTGLDHEVTPGFPSDYSGGNVVSVAATDYRDKLGSFSDYGAQHVHIGAPGVLIYSTTWSQTDPGGSYGTLSGTSMAAAYTSGVAALVLAHCNYTTGALRDALVRSAVRDGALTSQTQYGARLNAAAAVRSCDVPAGNGDIVVHAADIPQADRHGTWTTYADPSAADEVALATSDAGWSATNAPLAQPKDFVDIHVTAPAGVPYRVWLRLKAGANSKWNDSVWLQFSDAFVNGAWSAAINTDTAVAVNLENCSNCGVSGWGWQDGAYWIARSPVVFGSSGTQTLRVQTREDGVSFDQIVLSPGTWMSTPPGQVSGDSTIVPRSSGGSGGNPPDSSPMPFSGTPVLLPGTVQAEDFDTGGEGVSYHDSDAANRGGAYRGSGVDLESSSNGGVNVGWVEAGEWLAYTVNISPAGSYTVQFHVASSGAGGSFHMEIDGADATGPVSVPDTGSWQTWQTVSRPVSLPAGRHIARLVMDSAGTYAVGNFDSFAVVASSTASALPGRIGAADFDNGGEGVAYHDDSSGNSGGAYRSGDVDIESSSEGGYNVGWIAGGESLRYTVNVGASGSVPAEPACRVSRWRRFTARDHRHGEPDRHDRDPEDRQLAVVDDSRHACVAVRGRSDAHALFRLARVQHSVTSKSRTSEARLRLNG